MGDIIKLGFPLDFSRPESASKTAVAGLVPQRIT